MWMDLKGLLHLKRANITLSLLTITPNDQNVLELFAKSLLEVAGVFWRFKRWIEKQKGCVIQVLMSDSSTK